MIKIASNLTKAATKVPTKELLDMDSFGGAYADIFPFDPTGITGRIGHGGRAGRATAMADAIGMDPGFLVNYPTTSGVLSALLGSVAGAGLGDQAGAGLTYATGDDTRSRRRIGRLIGAAGGALGGAILSNILRRKKMKSIANAYEAAPSIDPKLHDPHILDLLGGYHNRARQRAIGAMLGSGENPSKVLTDEAVITGLGSALNYALPGVGFVPPVVSHFEARSKAVENKERKNKGDSSQEKKSATIKVASNLNKMCVKQAFLEVPYVEEQMLEQLNPGAVQHYKQARFPGAGALGALASRALRSYFEDANSNGLQRPAPIKPPAPVPIKALGLGAGGGLLREAFSAKPENAQYLRRALQGMSLGGLAGAGLGTVNMGKGIHTALEESAAKSHD